MHTYQITLRYSRVIDGEISIFAQNIGTDSGKNGTEILNRLFENCTNLGWTKPGVAYHIDKTRNEMSISGIGTFKVKRV